MRVILAIACLLHVSAKPLAENNNVCRVNEVYKCGTELCACKNEQDNRTPWMRFINAIISPASNKCQCNKKCTRVVDIPCKRGTCDAKLGQCRCLPCWTGVSCSRYSNQFSPIFQSSYVQIRVPKSLNSSRIVGKVMATDADRKQCVKGLQCPCADVTYQLVDGADDTFAINEKSGEILLSSTPYKDDYVLEIGAVNLEDLQSEKKTINHSVEKKSSKLFVHVDTRTYEGERLDVMRSRHRRSVSAGSLVLNIVPEVNGKYYYDIGDTINFIVSLKHNTSLTATTVSNVIIVLSSDFLKLQPTGLKSTKTGTFTESAVNDGDKLKITLTGSFAGGNTYDGNLTTVVKSSIGPLSTLKLTAELNATTNVYLKAKSSPLIYAVYPKVNLTRSSDSAVNVYGTKDFRMKITFPKLNYSLLAEITTNIESFIFMGIENVVVQNKGAKVYYNGTATPKPYATAAGGFNDRVVIDFGYVTNNADTDNTVEIAFTVKVYDHASLINNTLHWVGVGLQAGYRVLWVEQQAFNIIKEEPTLSASVASSNMTTNSTRLYIGDTLSITYSVNHTNASTANAVNVKITCYFENLVVPSSEIGNTLSVVNSTTVDVRHNGNVKNNIALGNVLTGSFKLQLAANVTPFVAATVKLSVSYENVNLVKKRPVTATLAGSVLAGTPNILMSLGSQSVKMKPGEKRNFSVVVHLTKMKCPIRFELVMPSILNASIFNILSVENAIIGSNIQGLNQNAVPLLKSSHNDAINNLAIYDLGTAINTSPDVSTSDANKIKLSFEVMLTDHANVTNGSYYWVGAGLVGTPNMIWVGQISMLADVPTDSRPRLSMKTSIVPSSSSSQFANYQYNIYLKHNVNSTKSAYDVKVRFFLPDYVKFVRMDYGSIPRVTHKTFGGSRLFEISGRFFFTDTFNITFTVEFVQANFPQKGKLYITTPIYLLYKSKDGKQYTLVKALQKSVDVPKETIPAITPVPGFYEKGFSWHSTGANTYTVYVCSDAKAKRARSACYYSDDKGTTWHATDSRVASVIGHYLASGNKYGISHDRLSYLKYDTELKQWISIPSGDYSPASDTMIKLEANTAGGNPVPKKIKNVATDKWGVSADGVYFKASGSSSWVKKSIWL